MLPSLVLSALALGVVGLWLAAAWWAYSDMRRRSDAELAQLVAAGWILLSTPALLPLSLMVYRMARPQATAAQRRTGDVITALTPDLAAVARCGTCGAASEDGWRRCPECGTWLEAACDGCGRWSPVELALCPWCATDRPATTELAPEPLPAIERGTYERRPAGRLPVRPARIARSASR